MKRIEKLRDLMHTTLNQVVWIETVISDDEQFIEIKITFGTRNTTFSFPIDEIEQNLLNGRDFATMIEKPLESLLKSEGESK